MSESVDPSFRISHQPLQILVVEDMAMMANAIVLKLEMLRGRFPDAKITSVGTWAAGIDVVSQVPHPDVVLLDIGLPDSKWEESISNVDEFERRSPVLIVTGHAEEKVKALLSLANPNIEVLHKDHSMWSKLIEYVARAMARGKSTSMDRITENIRILREMIANAPNEQ